MFMLYVLIGFILPFTYGLVPIWNAQWKKIPLSKLGEKAVNLDYSRKTDTSLLRFFNMNIGD